MRKSSMTEPMCGISVRGASLVIEIRLRRDSCKRWRMGDKGCTNFIVVRSIT